MSSNPQNSAVGSLVKPKSKPNTDSRVCVRLISAGSNGDSRQCS